MIFGKPQEKSGYRQSTWKRMEEAYRPGVDEERLSKKKKKKTYFISFVFLYFYIFILLLLILYFRHTHTHICIIHTNVK